LSGWCFFLVLAKRTNIFFNSNLEAVFIAEQPDVFSLQQVEVSQQRLSGNCLFHIFGKVFFFAQKTQQPMAPETFIRPYTPADLDDCLRCFESNVPLAFTVEEKGFFRDFLQNRVPQNPQTLPYYVLLSGKELIGCGGLGLNEDDRVSLTWGMVDKRFHKKGFGKALLDYRLEKFRELFPQKSLGLDTTQHAVGFFEKYGFRTEKFTPDSYAPGMHRYDMVF